MRHLKCFYYLKSREEFYFLQARGYKIMTGFPSSNKGWKRLFIRMTNLIRFGVHLRWKVANAYENQEPEVLPDEEEDYNKLLGFEFPWQLVLNKEELDRYWPRSTPPNVSPSVATPNDPILQTGEPNQVVFLYFSLWFSFLVAIDCLPFSSRSNKDVWCSTQTPSSGVN